MDSRRVLGSARPPSSPAPSKGIRDRSPASISISDESTPRPTWNGEGEAPVQCPICSEEMVTLLQLNQHLDDVHRELEKVQSESVKSWIKKRVARARRSQPVITLNQSLGRLDLYEPNENHARSKSLTQPAPDPRGEPQEDSTREQSGDEVVSRTHWQKTAPNQVCTEPLCGRSLNIRNGEINCRHCGKLFCDKHTMYQMKLSRSANHEPTHGTWCRVCETCFKSREGYNHHSGRIRWSIYCLPSRYC